MTEEIIVNDVNVAGCAYFRESRCFDCGTQAICCQHPNCYYKQLKRLEQENKVLKDIIDDGRAENKRFREENEELKEDIKQYNEWLDEERESREYWCKQSLPYRKYRSALEEIRKVINLAYKTGDYLLGQDYTDLVDRIEKELEVLK